MTDDRTEIETELDDNSEFLNGDNLITPDSQNSEQEEFENLKRYRSYVAKGVSRGMSLSQILPFRALAEIDEDRKDKIGLKGLLIAYCENGNFSWLNPGVQIGALEDTLRKFQGDRKVLRSLIPLLEQSAKEKISPSAFLRYVILPKLQFDMNWRGWETNHFSSIREIQKVLHTIKQFPQFEKEVIGSDTLHLARDIVLVKYIGRPLARLEPKVVSDKMFIDEYLSIWEKIHFKNYLFFQFIKHNVLPFLFHYSPKLEAFQILNIIRSLPALEVGFVESYPDNLYTWKKLPNYNLYETNFYQGREERLKKSYKVYDFYLELSGYISVLRKIIETRAGVYLAEFVARQITLRKNPVLPQQLEELIALLPNQGGLHTYKWHIKRFLGRDPIDRAEFTETIRNNYGLHPEYPTPFWLMQDPATKNEFSELRTLARDLGLEQYAIQCESRKENLSTKLLFNELVKQNLDQTPWIQDLVPQILSGKDRLWTLDTVRKADSIHSKFSNLLLRMMIRGLGNFFSSWKSTNLTQLWNGYKLVFEQPNLDKTYEFAMIESKEKEANRSEEEKIRKVIHLDLFSTILDMITKQEEFSVSEFSAHLGRKQIEIRKNLEAKQEKWEEMKSIDSSSNQKEFTKLTKAVSFLKEEYDHLETVIKEFDQWTFEQQIIFSLFYASQTLEISEPDYKVIFHLFKNYLLADDLIRNEGNALSEDIAVSNLQLYQIDAIQQFLSIASQEFQNHPKIKELWNLNQSPSSAIGSYFNLLSRYSNIKKNLVNQAALDAALKKFLQLGKIQAEKFKWLDFLKREEENPPIRHYSIVSSKSPIDAYFGDMGGICLSSFPEEILRPNLFNFRIVDQKDEQIIGMFLLTQSRKPIDSLGINEFWAAFAINPLFSVLQHWSKKEKITFYLQIRVLLEKIAMESKMPVFLAGRGTYGLLSEGSELADLIETLEKNLNSLKVNDAYSTDIYYKADSYARAIYAINPSDPLTFHGHRLLKIK